MAAEKATFTLGTLRDIGIDNTPIEVAVKVMGGWEKQTGGKRGRSCRDCGRRMEAIIEDGSPAHPPRFNPPRAKDMRSPFDLCDDCYEKVKNGG